MLIDSTLMLSDKQAVTASAASENIIDQTAAGDAHRHAVVVARVDEDFAGLTSLKISLQTADDEAFASPKELAAATFALADLKAGKALLNTVLPAGALRSAGRGRRAKSRCLLRTNPASKPAGDEKEAPICFMTDDAGR